EGSVEGPLGERAGGALTLSRLHVGPIYAVNGSTRDYGTAPQGWEASGSLVWDYRPTGQLKAFVIGETFETSFDVEEASFEGDYDIESDASAAIVTWRDRLGAAEPVVSLSRSGARSEEAGGAFRLLDDRVSTQLFAAVAVPRGSALVLTAGGELERLDAALTGEIPRDSADRGEGAPTDPLDFDGEGERHGLFLETEWAATSRLGVTAGIRTDRSTLSDERTWDPRLSLAWNPRPNASLLLAGGVYHQVADPLLYARSAAPLASQRAIQLVAGVQAGTPSEGLFRVEAFLKRYDDLAQLDRDDRAIGGGQGESKGIDVFLKGSGPWDTSGWISWSLVDAERTDPDTNTLTRAPFDVTHSLIAVVGREIRPGWNARAAWRYATGRPFTDVAGAAPSPDGPVIWIPTYDEPFGGRQPAFHRLDLSFSRLVFFGEDGLLVLFASLNNVYDRFNVLEYRWSRDYAERFPVRDRSARSVFVGMSIDF
ncbi:MAG TPA: TonB-dependent receptor, partial [Gemmatimonadota bacterium]|nr:TonB-dependent receptor [Gemmatimonadota bacterium]